MKKSDLLKLLADVGDDDEILVDGYESGFDEPTVIRRKARRYREGEDPDPYAGEFVESNDGVPVVVISRRE